MSNVNTRLAKLEREMKRLMGMLANGGKDPSIKTMNELRVKRLCVVDENDKIRAVMAVGNDGSPGLGMIDEGGKERVMLAVAKDGSVGLVLKDEKGKNRAVMTLAPDGSPALCLKDNKG